MLFIFKTGRFCDFINFYSRNSFLSNSFIITSELIAKAVACIIGTIKIDMDLTINNEEVLRMLNLIKDN